MNGNAETRATRQIAVALGVTTVAALCLAAVYLTGGQSQLEGIALAVALGGLGFAMVVTARKLLPQGPFTEDREPLESSADDIDAFARDFDAVYQLDPEGGPESEAGIGRRKLITRMLGAAAGALGLAALFPIASLGPRPGNSLFVTKWRKGSRVVNEQGHPVQVDDLEVGGVITVFPEGPSGRRRQPDAPDPARRAPRSRPGPGARPGDRRATSPTRRSAPTRAARSASTSSRSSGSSARATSRRSRSRTVRLRCSGPRPGRCPSSR